MKSLLRGRSGRKSLTLTRRSLSSLVLACAASAVTTSAIAAADPLNFDIATLQSNGFFVTYGDAQSYALQVACTQTGQSSGTNCAWYTSSSTGQIKDLTVIGAHSGGQVFPNNYPGAMDDAYELPETPNNSSQLQDYFFRTGTQTITNGATSVTFGSPDPNGAGEWTGAAETADRANTWDTKLSALMDFTNKRDPVFFFVNNQTNSASDGLAAEVNQTLAAWAQLWITDDITGAVVGVWEFTNNNGKYDVVPNGGGVAGGSVGTFGVNESAIGVDPDVGSNNDTDYVLSGGPLCFKYQTGNSAPAPGDDIVSCGEAFDYKVNNNLGDNQAAYALFFPEMNAKIAEIDPTKWGNYTMHMDIRLGCDPLWYGSDPLATNINADCAGKRLTNGGEQIFVGAAFERPDICVENPDLPECQPPQIPEPASLALVGLGLLGLAVARRRQAAGMRFGATRSS